MNAADLAILAVLALAVFFALRRMVRNRKNGCSCGCESCDRNCPAQRRERR